MAAIKISEGMSADDVLDVLGQPRAREVVASEGKEHRVPNWIVEWTYRSIKITLARRELDGVVCYRVIEIEEVLDEL